MILDWIKARIVLLGAGLAGLAAFAVIASLAWKLGVANGTIDALRKDIVTTNDAWHACQTREATANARIVVQNGEIQTWRDKAAAAQAEADRRVLKARIEAQQLRERAKGIMARQASGDHCVAAAALYVEEIGGER